MTPIQPIIREILIENDRVKELIAERVYDLILPSGHTIPAITIQRISETLNASTIAGNTLLQIDAYSHTHAQAETVAEAVRQALTNTTKAGDPDILGIVPQNTIDTYTPDNRLFRVTTDYLVSWRKK